MTPVNGPHVSWLSIYLRTLSDVNRLSHPSIRTKMTQRTYSYFEINVVHNIGARTEEKFNQAIMSLTYTVEVLGSTHDKDPNILIWTFS
jgi:hypothetical protein